ncbi:exoenzymes regulatory protein AepA [Klebsiella michiganensis]|nr:exoenzymes regulatory protein AepA [Klebsiella michiganensis]
MLEPFYYLDGHNGAWNATPEEVEQQVYDIMSRATRFTATVTATRPRKRSLKPSRKP